MAQNDQKFREVLSRHFCSFDGFWPHAIARFRLGKQIEKIPGSEFIHKLFAHAATRKLRVFLLGATQEVNEAARQRIARQFEIQVGGYAPAFEPYPYRAESNQRILDEIRGAQPQILLIAFGAPKQEFWLDEHRQELEAAGVRLAMAVGGALDMIAGLYQKAPPFLCSIGLEGVWRVLMDPKRIKRFPNPLRFFRVALYD